MTERELHVSNAIKSMEWLAAMAIETAKLAINQISFLSMPEDIREQGPSDEPDETE